MRPRSRGYPICFRKHERSMPSLIGFYSTVGFGIAEVFLAFSNPTLSIALGVPALVVSVVLEILTKKGIGLQRGYSLDRKETVRLLGERAAARWIARFYRDLLEKHEAEDTQ
jgi:hypothetical protein